MAIGKMIKRSREEILDQTARIVAGTINPEKMNQHPDEVDVEHFIEHFKEALSQLLYNKEAVYLAIGLAVNTDFSGIYSHDMQFILESIEKEMDTKFYFYHGIVLWVCKNDLYAVWLPH